MNREEELQCVISDLCGQVRERDAEIARLRSELRDITIALDDDRTNNTMTAAEVAADHNQIIISYTQHEMNSQQHRNREKGMTDQEIEYALDGDVVLIHQLVDEYRQMCDELNALKEKEPVITKRENGMILHAGWDDLPEGAKKVGDLLAAVYDARQEIKTMRALLERQWQADAALYSLPHDCERHEHERWLTEHDAAHKAVGDFLGHNAK